MKSIKEQKNSLLNKLLKEAEWIGKDDWPSGPEWQHEVEIWLKYIDKKKWIHNYWPRLVKQHTKERDDAFSEIKSAYFLEEKCDLLIKELEPFGKDRKKGEFILSIDDIDIFCEVKSPGWEAEIIKKQGINLQRLKLPKYINGEFRWVDNADAIRYAVERAYEKIPHNKPSLLIIAGDFFLSVLEGPKPDGMPLDVYRSLYYKPRQKPYVDDRPPGCFITDQYKMLSAILFLQVKKYCKNQNITYENRLFLNNRSLYKISKTCQNKLRYHEQT